MLRVSFQNDKGVMCNKIFLDLLIVSIFSLPHLKKLARASSCPSFFLYLTLSQE